jgi:major membrane immunogen (membrane-anchored lipoprotein)
MKKTLTVVGITSALLLTGCGASEKEEVKTDPAAYNKCLEDEAAKWLDETGSNLDYANEKAAEACADLM